MMNREAINNLNDFQQKVMLNYWKAHATEEELRLADAKHKTIGGCWEYIMSVLKARFEESDGKDESVVVTDNDFVFEHTMHYFRNLREGYTFRTEREQMRRDAEAKQKRELHRKRLAEWAGLTREEILAKLHPQPKKRTTKSQTPSADKVKAINEAEQKLEDLKAKRKELADRQMMLFNF